MEYENQLSSSAKYDCLMFDLDDTLYPLSSGISDHITSNIKEYMVQKLGVEESKVTDLNYFLYKNYGTTMAGLKAIGYDFDYDDYHGFVHGMLPYDNLLKSDSVLRTLLLSLPLRKIVFTNSDKSHASRVLGRLGLEDCFDEVIHFETLNFTLKGDHHHASYDEANGSSSDKAAALSTVSGTEAFDIVKFAGQSSNGFTLPKTPLICKPFEDAFRLAFEIANVDPQKTLFFDDSVRNLITAKQLGLHTVLVGLSERPKGVDYAIESIHNIKEAIPELVEAEDKAENAKYSHEIPITVRA